MAFKVINYCLSPMFKRFLTSSFIAVMAVVALTSPATTWASIGAPTNLTIVGGTYNDDQTPTFTWSPVSDAYWYDYQIDTRVYDAISNVLTVTLNPLSEGQHTFRVRAHNFAGDISAVTSITFTIDADDYDNDNDDDNDSNPNDLVVPTVTPSSATEDESVTIKVSPYGDEDVDDCDLYVDGDYEGDMSQSGATFQRSYTFSNNGSYSVYARCTDEDGYEVKGSTRTVTVYNQDEDIIDSNDAREGELIKTSCTSGAGVNDPCKAVYYWGEDGLRHAFPNEDVFYSWYTDFDDVIEISTSDMSDLRIGHNVTIKPGTSVVKFATSDDVYAVSEGGILHHYVTTSLLVGDYGSDWSTRDLVVISDVFYGNYTIGSVIDSSSDYDPEQTIDMVTSIDDNF